MISKAFKGMLHTIRERFEWVSICHPWAIIICNRTCWLSPWFLQPMTFASFDSLKQSLCIGKKSKQKRWWGFITRFDMVWVQFFNSKIGTTKKENLRFCQNSKQKGQVHYSWLYFCFKPLSLTCLFLEHSCGRHRRTHIIQLDGSAHWMLFPLMVCVDYF